MSEQETAAMGPDDRTGEAPASGDGAIEKTGQDVPARVGRKRDQTRNAVILEAALEVLAEVGYASMTMDLVAVRARAGKATVYRRWSSKSQLVLDAVAHMKRSQVDLGRLPDTGTLRGDLVGLIRPQSIEEAEHRLKVMAGLASVLSHDPELTDAVNAAIHEPWVDAYRVLFQRAIGRGEIRMPADIETVLHVVPSMAAFRVMIQRKPVDRDFLVSLIDGLLLPALRPAEGHGSGVGLDESIRRG